MAKFMIGDKVTVASNEGLDTPREIRGKTGVVTGYLYDAGKVVEYWVEVRNFPKFNATEYHISLTHDLQYDVQYPGVRSLGQGHPGPHKCEGCGRLFVKGEIFEIGSVRLHSDVWIVINVHRNDECREFAISQVTK